MTTAALKDPSSVPPTVAQLYAKAFWQATPTTSLKEERQLAYALGYPSDWRVERTIITNSKSSKKEKIIQDKIHASFGKTKKKQSIYTWLHHEAAQEAAAQVYAAEAAGETLTSLESGSHLLPPVPLYTKGDLIQVRWEDQWYEATITKRKKHADQFLYSVYYHEDDATQDEIDESEIRPGEDPHELAQSLGFPATWKAGRKGARYTFTAPTGERFTTKKKALEFLDASNQKNDVDEDVGDPPWRTEGHEWIGRQIEWISHHKASGTRKVKLTQVGTIQGYILDTDTDREGNPGFISEATGQPTTLFHVVFPDEPHHPYATHLLNSQDLEESEVVETLLAETPAAKRKREAALAKKQTPQKASSSSSSPKSSTPKRKKRRSRY